MNQLKILKKELKMMMKMRIIRIKKAHKVKRISKSIKIQNKNMMEKNCPQNVELL